MSDRRAGDVHSIKDSDSDVKLCHILYSCPEDTPYKSERNVDPIHKSTRSIYAVLFLPLVLHELIKSTLVKHY